jgi:5'-phosphate synthase pdxT subunit
VLALQGDFARHAEALALAGRASVEVRRPEDLDFVSGLVLPGGESTTLLKFFDREGWPGPLRAFAASGKPVLATCAGLILLAKKVENPDQESLGLIDVDVVRNAYGRQVDSFIGRSIGPDRTELETVFIRAPKISRVGSGVTVLAREGNDPVWVAQDSLHGATFHPELSPSSEVHRRVFGQ